MSDKPKLWSEEWLTLYIQHAIEWFPKVAKGRDATEDEKERIERTARQGCAKKMLGSYSTLATMVYLNMEGPLDGTPRS